MSRPACHRPPNLPPNIPFDGGRSDPRMVRRNRIGYVIVFLLWCLSGLYMYTKNVVYLYVAGVVVGVMVLGALAWTALMCMILCREDDGIDEEMGGGRRGRNEKGRDEKGLVRGKEDVEFKRKGDVEKGDGGGERKVDGILESIERALARKDISIEVGL